MLQTIVNGDEPQVQYVLLYGLQTSTSTCYV